MTTNPTNINAVAGVNKITLSWDVVSGATGYRVYRSENGGSSYTTAIYNSSANSFSDLRSDVSTGLKSVFPDFTAYLGLEYGKTYTYKVTAYDGGGESSGVTVSAIPVADTAYSGGSVRGKILACLIVVNTDHVPAQNPALTDIQAMHDWLRANITTKITLFISKQILFATSGSTLSILNYMKSLVTSYNYDIVTLPHLAWFPTTTRWSEGLTTELANITGCHNQCYNQFGKYPIWSQAYHYSKDFIPTLISCGYKLSSSGFREQAPNHPDGWGSLGFPYHLYKASKNNALVPGSGSSDDTFDIVSGVIPIQSGLYRANNEPTAGADPTALGCGDMFPSLFGQQLGIKQMLEDSQVMAFNQFHMIPLYFDAYWAMNSSYNIVLPNGDRETWYMSKQIALWLKQRYGSTIGDFVSASEFSNYVYNTVTTGHPPYCTLSYQGQEGSWRSAADKQIRYDCQHYSVIVRHKAGPSGYISDIQEIPYSPSIVEPSFPNNNWNIAGGWYRSNSTPAREIKLTIDGVSRSLLNSDNYFNIHAPQVTSSADSATLTWNIYDAMDTTLLLSLISTFASSGYSSTYANRHSSVATITETNNITAQTVALVENGTNQLPFATVVFSNFSGDATASLSADSAASTSTGTSAELQPVPTIQADSATSTSTASAAELLLVQSGSGSIRSPSGAAISLFTVNHQPITIKRYGNGAWQ